MVAGEKASRPFLKPVEKGTGRGRERHRLPSENSEADGGVVASGAQQPQTVPASAVAGAAVAVAGRRITGSA